MVKMRRCIGSAKYGIEAHEAPTGSFPVQPSQKDGLGRMCKPHWNQYTRALRKAALARKAEGGETPGAERPEKVWPLGGPQTPKEPKPRQAKAAKPESPKVRKAKAVLDATESLGGKAYTDAIGSDEVQAALEGGGQEDTFEQDVRAILAEV